LNDSAKQLLGFDAMELEQTRSLWTDRIHPQDRAEFLAAWQRFQNGETRISCEYRFSPKHKEREIRIREISCAAPLSGKTAPAIWSFYTADASPAAARNEGAEIGHIRELLHGLTHEIGNILQAIRGELDLLRLAGALTQQSSKSITHGFQQIRNISHEFQEYLAPPPPQLSSEDLAMVLTEVIRDSEQELAAHGIQMAVVLREPLPKLPLDWQFRSALKRIIEFSCALLPQGGELKIEAGLQRIGEERFVEFNLVNASPTFLTLEEKDVFRPFLKVNDCYVGLSMALARQVLRRHFGKIAFRKQRNHGIFSILMKVPPGG
jgi:signal transduction histidine kinase